MLRFSLLCLSLATGLAMAMPLEEAEQLPSNMMVNPNNPDEMMYYVPAEKRSPHGQANQLRDLLHALEMEAAEEEAEAEQEPEMPMMARGAEGIEDGNAVVAPAAALGSRDKRRRKMLKRRRYGFWVTAINKMGNLKRSQSHFIPALGGRPRAKKFVTGNMRSAVRG